MFADGVQKNNNKNNKLLLITNKFFFTIFFLFVSPLTSWNKYRILWMNDKQSICEKFINRASLSLVRIDENFIFYTQIVNDLEKHKTYCDIKSIRLNLKPLIGSIVDHAIEWRNIMGEKLGAKTKSNMEELRNHIQVIGLVKRER
jgi:dynein heavy chain, axonemal